MSPTSRGFFAFDLALTMHRELLSQMLRPSGPGARVKVSVVDDIESYADGYLNEK